MNTPVMLRTYPGALAIRGKLMTSRNDTTTVRTYHIYTLINPTDDKTFYVGCSVDPNARLSGHLAEIERRDKRALYIAEMMDKGIKPKMKIIDSIDASCFTIARYLEQYWILRYRNQGIKLFNTDRATQCWDKLPSQETIDKVRELAGYPLDQFRERLEEYYVRQSVLEFDF